jgi:DNA-binding transcriptional MerR regulator
MAANLNVDQMAKVAGCHRNTVLNYEKEGFITPVRDHNNHRRYTLEQALKLKKLFEIRRPAGEN